MLLRVFKLLALVLVCLKSYPQNTEGKIYYDYPEVQELTGIKNCNNSYTIALRRIDFDSKINFVDLLQFDQNGLLKSTKTLDFYSMHIREAVVHPAMPDNAFLFGQFSESIGSTVVDGGLILIKLDCNNDTVWTKKFRETTFLLPSFCKVTSTGNFIFCSVDYNTNNEVLYHLVDSSGTLIVRTAASLVSIPYYSVFHDLVELPASNQILISTDANQLVRLSNQDFSFDSVEFSASKKIDAYVEKLSDYGGNGFVVTAPYLDYKDTGVGMNPSWDPTERSEIFLYRFDENFNQVSKSYFKTSGKCEMSDAYTGNTDLLDTNNLFIAYPSYYNSDEPEGDLINAHNRGTMTKRRRIRSSIVVINSDINGNLKWQKDFLTDNVTNNYHVYKVFATPDSGALIFSIVFDFINDSSNLTKYLHVLKVNKDGGTVGLNELLAGAKVRAYPNPVADELRLTFLQGEHPYAIWSVLGDELATGITSGSIDMRIFPPGVYFVKVEGNSPIQVLKE